MSQDEYPRFGDFAEETTPFEGDKIKIDDLLNKELLILGFKIRDSKQKPDTIYATIQLKLNDKENILFTASQVIIDQLNKYKENIPFHATIRKIDRYYTFS